MGGIYGEALRRVASVFRLFLGKQAKNENLAYSSATAHLLAWPMSIQALMTTITFAKNYAWADFSYRPL